MIINTDTQQVIEDSKSANNDAPPSYSRAADSTAGSSSAIMPEPISDSKSGGPSFPQNPPLDGAMTTSSSGHSYYAPSTFRGQASHDPNLYAPFSRVPDQQLVYDSFPPMFLVAISKALEKGFPSAPPPSTTRQHPFISHDVTEEDWLRFLQEIYFSAQLTEKDIYRSHIPIVSMIPFVSPMARFGVQKFMKSQKKHKVVKVIDTWNHHFFGPRKIRVMFMRGWTKLSGATDAPLLTSPSYVGKFKLPGSSDPAFGPEVNWNDDVFRLLVVSTV